MSWFEERAGLRGTVAVVTGGAGGLGEAIVTDLAANGVRLAIIDIDPKAITRLRNRLSDDKDNTENNNARNSSSENNSHSDNRAHSNNDATDQPGNTTNRREHTTSQCGNTADQPGNTTNQRRDMINQRGDVIIRHGDARDPDALAALFEAVDERWGRVDTLVNIVGGTFRAPFTETKPKGWDALLRTNLMHVLHACSLAVPRMRAGGRGGSIINLTTIEAHRAAPGFAVYSAAKAAVEQFARSLAVEVAPDGIRVNNIAPDYTPTPNMTKFAEATPNDDGIGVTIPMGRAGQVTDVSGCAVFLASNLSAYITGTTLHPDGGTFASSGWLNWPNSGWSTRAPQSLLNNPPSEQ